MILRIKDIEDKSLSLTLEESPDDFPVLAEMIKKGEYEFNSLLNIRIEARKIISDFEVKGRFTTEIKITCSRCLKVYNTALEADFYLVFSKENPEEVDNSDNEGIELSAFDTQLILFHGEEIDLEEAIQDQVVMAFPIKPLCTEDCSGLCVKCGNDLNNKECGCDRSSGNNQFAALKDLKLNK